MQLETLKLTHATRSRTESANEVFKLPCAKGVGHGRVLVEVVGLRGKMKDWRKACGNTAMNSPDTLQPEPS